MIYSFKKYCFSLLMISSILTGCQSLPNFELGSEVISDLNPAGEDVSRSIVADSVLPDGKSNENLPTSGKNAVK